MAGHDTQTDSDLMVRYRDGDAAAFDALYARCRGPLFRFLTRQCKDRELASELFQEVWIRIINARERYEPAAKFTTWMFQIAHNCFIDHIRRQTRRPQADDGAEPEALADMREPSPPEALARDETAARLRAAIAALPSEQREAFLMRREGDLSVDDIARATGVGRETAKSRLRYAAASLRRALAQEVTNQ